MKNAKPIICSTKEVEDILNGKSQFRTVINISRYELHKQTWEDGEIVCSNCVHIMFSHYKGVCPNCFKEQIKHENKVGDMLFVQEEFSISSGFDGMDISLAKIAYGGDFYDCAKYRNDGREKEDWNGKWREANTMTKEFARIFQKVTAIRVERLQDISYNDILSDGVFSMSDEKGHGFTEKAFTKWINIWNSEHKDGEKFSDNPYVIVEDRERVGL